MSALDRIKETITEALMNSRGWDEISKEKNSIEWDPNREDSQYSLIKEDVNFVVDEFVEQLAGLEQDELEEEYVFDDEKDEDEDEDGHGHTHDHGHDHTHEHENIFDEYGHIKRTQTNTTSAAIFIFMDAGTGNARYVKDVREWLATVDRLGVPDDSEVEGTLHISVDVREPYIERLECGGCGSKDVLLTVHSCEETPC
jgi:hypothetical protein